MLSIHQIYTKIERTASASALQCDAMHCIRRCMAKGISRHCDALPGIAVTPKVRNEMTKIYKFISAIARSSKVKET
jgi:hypothetical protein